MTKQDFIQKYIGWVSYTDRKKLKKEMYADLNALIQALQLCDGRCSDSRKYLNMENVKMKFKDAPIGARFKYPNMEKIWVKINSYPKGQFNDGNGLIVQWNGNVEGHQSHCSFVDENLGIDFDTVVELV